MRSALRSICPALKIKRAARRQPHDVADVREGAVDELGFRPAFDEDVSLSNQLTARDRRDHDDCIVGFGYAAGEAEHEVARGRAGDEQRTA
jgi:hypothetical protein